MKFTLWTLIWFGLLSINQWIILSKYGIDAYEKYVEKTITPAFAWMSVILWIVFYLIFIK